MTGRAVLANALLLLVCAVDAGFVALALGKDKSWDLMNYHFYNPYAFLHGRMGWDLAPAQVQTYLNPLPDFPFYALVTTLSNPRLVTFAMGALHGIAVFFLIKIAWLMLGAHPWPMRLFLTAAAVGVGTTGAAALPLVGGTSNDWIVAVFVLAGLLVALASAARERTGRPGWVEAAIAGALVGIAFGLKPTAAPFAVALVLGMLAAEPRWQRGLAIAVAAGVGVVAGMAIGGGVFMWQLARMFGNPVFPYYNDVFRSPFWEPHRFRIDFFKPRDALQWVFYPFYWVRTTSMLVTEPPMRDARFAAIMTLSALWILRAALRPRSGAATLGDRASPGGLARARRLFAVFFLVSYVVWLALFSIYRYLAPLDLLAGLAIVLLLLAVVPAAMPVRAVSVVAVSIALLVTTVGPNWTRAPFERRYFEVEAPALPEQALVLVVGGSPMSYVIPLMRPDARFVGVANNFLRPRQRNELSRAIRKAIRTHPGPIFALNTRQEDDLVAEALAGYHLEKIEPQCAVIPSTLDHGTLKLCALRRTS